MRTNDFLNSIQVNLDYLPNGKLDWSKFEQSFTHKLKESKSYQSATKLINENLNNLKAFKKQDRQSFNQFISIVNNETWKKHPSYVSEAQLSLPKSDADVSNIVSMLKTGIKADTAAYKLYNVLGDTGLFDLIGTLKSHNVEMDVSPVVTTTIMAIETTDVADQFKPYVKKLQESILSDVDLICQVLVPVKINEASNSQQISNSKQSASAQSIAIKQPAISQPTPQTAATDSPIAKILHTDLENLKKSGQNTSDQRAQKLAMRAAQYKIDPNKLKSDYNSEFQDEGMLEDNRAVYRLSRLIEHSKPKSKEKLAEIVYEVALQFNYTPSLMESKFRKFLESKKTTINTISESSTKSKFEMVIETIATDYKKAKKIFEEANKLNEFDTKEELKKRIFQYSIKNGYLPSRISDVFKADVSLIGEDVIDFPLKNLKKVEPKISADHKVDVNDQIIKVRLHGSGAADLLKQELDKKFYKNSDNYTLNDIMKFVEEIGLKVVKDYKISFNTLIDAFEHKFKIDPWEYSRKLLANISEDVVPFVLKNQNKPRIHIGASIHDISSAQDMKKDMLLDELESRVIRTVKTIADKISEIDMNVIGFFLKHDDVFMERFKKLEDMGITFKQFMNDVGDILIHDYAKKVIKINEDVVNFTGNTKPKETYNLPATVFQMPSKQELAELDRIVQDAKKLIDETDLSNADRKFIITHNIRQWLVKSNISVSDFTDEFKLKFGEDYFMYIHEKEYDDHIQNLIDQQTNESINEGINCLTAQKCRTDIGKLLKKFVDSSDIHFLSNFESYEKSDLMSLKINVYEDSVKKLNLVIDHLKAALVENGFLEKKLDGNESLFKKDGVIVKVHPVRRTFRTGAYKNREANSIGIEILGSKKIIKTDDELNEAVSKRKACDKCGGIPHAYTNSTMKCGKCFGKGWVTPQNVINWAKKLRARDKQIIQPPKQYKDD